jgi:K(+)-stimulated pyrophosphate-energized sodium pump
VTTFSLAVMAAALAPALAHASEASLILPDLNSVQFVGFGGATLLAVLGVVVCGAGLVFGIVQFNALSNMPVHRSMKEISELIYETCKTYLITQMRFIGILWVFVAAIILVYFKWLAVDHEGTCSRG